MESNEMGEDNTISASAVEGNSTEEKPKAMQSIPKERLDKEIQKRKEAMAEVEALRQKVSEWETTFNTKLKEKEDEIIKVSSSWQELENSYKSKIDELTSHVENYKTSEISSKLRSLGYREERFKYIIADFKESGKPFDEFIAENTFEDFKVVDSKTSKVTSPTLPGIKTEKNDSSLKKPSFGQLFKEEMNKNKGIRVKTP